MRCRHCKSRMHQTDSVTEGRVRQTWYECPVCATTQTVASPQESSIRRVGNSLRCSCRWPEAQRAFGV